MNGKRRDLSVRYKIACGARLEQKGLYTMQMRIIGIQPLNGRELAPVLDVGKGFLDAQRLKKNLGMSGQTHICKDRWRTEPNGLISS